MLFGEGRIEKEHWAHPKQTVTTEACLPLTHAAAGILGEIWVFLFTNTDL